MRPVNTPICRRVCKCVPSVHLARSRNVCASFSLLNYALFFNLSTLACTFTSQQTQAHKFYQIMSTYINRCHMHALVHAHTHAVAHTTHPHMQSHTQHTHTCTVAHTTHPHMHSRTHNTPTHAVAHITHTHTCTVTPTHTPCFSSHSATGGSTQCSSPSCTRDPCPHWPTHSRHQTPRWEGACPLHSQDS